MIFIFLPFPFLFVIPYSSIYNILYVGHFVKRENLFFEKICKLLQVVDFQGFTATKKRIYAKTEVGTREKSSR